jgi:hypothetical protein
MLMPVKPCRYCSQRILLLAKVCQYCERHQSPFWQHFRVDQIGLLISFFTIIIALGQLNAARGQLNEATKQRIEATETLERIKRAEVTVTNLQNLVAEAREALSDLRSNANFNLLLTKANNDDRAAFDEIVDISRKPGSFQSLAVSAINRIVMDIDPMVSVRIDPNVPWDKYHIDLSKSSLQELLALYTSIPSLYRPRYLSDLWKQERFARGALLQMLYNVIQHESSLRALHRACVLMNQEAKINKNILGAHLYLLWWEQNKLRYE